MGLTQRWSSPLRKLCGIACAALIAASVMVGCQSPMRTPHAELRAGDYGKARMAMRKNLTHKRSDRRYLLDRMRLGVLTLADGYPESAQTIFEEVYDILRTQGINKDKTVASVVLNEDLKIWKGEPFEQALAMMYYGLVQAEQGSWDNARAAMGNSLFYLRDFGENDQGERLDTYEIARKSLAYERAIDAGQTPSQAQQQADYLDTGYVPRESNFTLGYLLSAIANQQLGILDEAQGEYARVLELDSELESLVSALSQGSYNTILVVSWGLGPEKRGYGPDNALARFSPRTRSNDADLRVRVGDFPWQNYAQVYDVNTMAADHMWNNLEDVRVAKSVIGTGLIYGGLIATQVGAHNNSDEAVYAGLGALAAGAFLKAGAHVDIRYADIMPQRFYVVPLHLAETEQPITLQVENQPASRIVLRGLASPRTPLAQLRYVRLITNPTRDTPPTWAGRGEVHYGNTYTGPASDAPLPYILGGNDVRPPSERAMDDYQQAGYMQGQTLSYLRDLYQAESLRWTLEDQGGYAGRHILEGGKSLVAPLPGTVGFARLMGQRHPPYRQRSEMVANFVKAMKNPPQNVKMIDNQ